MEEEEGENYPMEQHRVTQHRVLLIITPEKEVFHLITSEWWMEEVNMRLQPWRQIEARQERHYVSVTPPLSMKVNHSRARGFLDFSAQTPLPQLTQSSMDLLIWNYRGAGNKRFKRNMRELVRIHKPYLLVLLETKVEFSAMGMFFNRMGFTTSAHVDPIGRSGGIWMNYSDWILSAIYASPCTNKRAELWQTLEDTAQAMSEPWLVAGHFNDFANQSEKRSLLGGHNRSQNQDQRRTQKFLDRMNNCNLMDLGCTGPRLTWTNNRKGWANTMVRLDRAMCNTEWRATFPIGLVQNLPRTDSDHSPLMIFTQGKVPPSPRGNSFKFMAAWISHMDFQSVVESNWTNSPPHLMDKLEKLACKASEWNKDKFGNIFRNKRDARELSFKCGIPLTENLGKYLGVPLIHGRVNRGHFSTILEKMQNRLAGWKASVLSLAGRTTLIQSVSSALPAYTMQTMDVPVKVCNDIDRLNRKFLWGDTIEKRKMHLVNWE
ncbi:hypothetical protein ACSBR2_012022 [Camellia fascicularis]